LVPVSVVQKASEKEIRAAIENENGPFFTVVVSAYGDDCLIPHPEYPSIWKQSHDGDATDSDLTMNMKSLI